MILYMLFQIQQTNYSIGENGKVDVTYLYVMRCAIW